MENTVLRDLLSLKEVSDQRDVLGIDERYIKSQQALLESSMKGQRHIVVEKIKQSVEEMSKKLLQWINNSSDINSEPLLIDHSLCVYNYIIIYNYITRIYIYFKGSIKSN